MKILSVRTLNGPNVFHHKPIIKVTVDLEEYAELASCNVPGLIDRLLALLPPLTTHCCSKGYAGGFVERLRTGTYFAHIAEHITLALTEMAGIPVAYGKTVYAGREGVYDIALRFEALEATKYLARAALEVLTACAEGEDVDLADYIKHARELVAEKELGPSTRAIVTAAERRGIPWRRLNGASLVQLGYGIQRRFIQATESQATSSIGVGIASDKDLTKTLLDEAGLPVPRGVVVTSAKDLETIALQLSGPFAVKPLDGNQGRGVTLNITSPDELAKAFEAAQQISPKVIVEEFFRGRDYRILIVDGRLVAASERIPAFVTGDGERSIEQLIDIENQNPLRGADHEKPLTRIKTDSALLHKLMKSGLSLQSIPERGETIKLRGTANLSTGGIARDVTDTVHPAVAESCIRATQAIGLNICGVDIIHPDISQPWPENSAGIVELNAAPGIRMHEFPSEGKARPAGDAIVNSLYPGEATGRIPILSITGTNGKTTTTRLLAHLVETTDARVGMTTSDGVFIGGKCVSKGDTTGYKSCTTVLSDPTVEVAVLEVARGGLIRRGLAYDWSNISILTNIQPDHFGQDGIEDLNDLVKIKSLVAERVQKGGALVLNADDPIVRDLPDRPSVARISREVIYYSTQGKSTLIKRHLSKGGRAYYVENGWIIEGSGSSKRRLARTKEAPQSFGGSIEFQLSNSLAAIAAARAFGLTVLQVQYGLRTFTADKNPGRLNWFKVREGIVVVDYGHNPGAFQAMNGLLGRWQGKRTGVIGLPGDRSPELLESAATVAASCFDKLIIREDIDTRGRRPGEVAAMIQRVVTRDYPQKKHFVELNEARALDAAIRQMEPGELVVIFYENRSALEPVLEKYAAQLLTDFSSLERTLRLDQAVNDR